MIDERLDAALHRLPTVDLARLEVIAPLQTRRDRKYLVPLADAIRLVELLPDDTRVLAIGAARSFRYASVYLDTPELTSYLAAARGRPDRWKVRVRSYLDTGASVVEVKRRDRRGRTVKVRRAQPAALGPNLDDGGRAFVAGCAGIGEQAAGLRPVLRTGYRRSTMLLPEGDRLTIDVGLCTSTIEGPRVALGGVAIIETKSQGAPCAADHALWRLGHRPVRVSKYCTSLAVLRPDLPSNRWTRALRWPWVVSDARATGGRAGSQVATAAR